MLIRVTAFLLFGCHSWANFTVYMRAAGCTIVLSIVFTISDKLNFLWVGINLFPSLFHLFMFYVNVFTPITCWKENALPLQNVPWNIPSKIEILTKTSVLTLNRDLTGLRNMRKAFPQIDITSHWHWQFLK